jgi:hypothetical protein
MLFLLQFATEQVNTKLAGKLKISRQTQKAKRLPAIVQLSAMGLTRVNL